jgi:hypothetical protein
MTDYRSTYVQNKQLNPYLPSFLLKNNDIDGIIKRNSACKMNQDLKSET